jgi:hypothetical protein
MAAFSSHLCPHPTSYPQLPNLHGSQLNALPNCPRVKAPFAFIMDFFYFFTSFTKIQTFYEVDYEGEREEEGKTRERENRENFE